MRAVCLIRPALVYRREAFSAGLRAVGFKVDFAHMSPPKRDDVLVIWNRYGYADYVAKEYEARGAAVIVCENGYLGKDWLNDSWFAIALNHHAGVGKWRVGGPERWDDLKVSMEPFREDGKELLILGQRGIGEQGIASPRDWAQIAQRRHGGRIRPHPGDMSVRVKPVALEDDLEGVGAAATWASAAGLRCLLLGVPVFHGLKKWIGAGAAVPMHEMGGDWSSICNRDPEKRLEMFRRLIWAQWRLSEIESGEAFRWLLDRPADTGKRSDVQQNPVAVPIPAGATAP